MSLVEVAWVAGAWKYLGSRKTGRARGLSGRRSRSFLRPLFPSACYAGYVEVALSSNFMVFPKRHYFYLVPRQGNSHTCLQSVGTVAPAPPASHLRSLDLFANHLPQTTRRIPLEGGGAQE